jgi:transcriptional regulator
MYLPKRFEEIRPERLHPFIATHPLGLLVTMDANGLVANPIPFLLLPERGAQGTLIGHVARANPVWRESRADVQAMVVFQGPQGYVSPGWYASKAEHGKVVPTWNYASVVARGPLVVRDERDAVLAVVRALTDRHEGRQRTPWSVDDAPPEYIDQLLKAIVAIELPISSLVGKLKLSQNYPLADRLGAEAGLAERGEASDTALLLAMQAAREQP